MVNSVFGALWLLSCIFSSLGTFNQIKHNCNRRSVSGLSLFDSEIRLYGKIPWLLFACGFGATDWWILSINGIGVLLALVVLLQFLFYSEETPIIRTFTALFILSLSMILLFRFDLSEYQYINTILPVLTSLILIPIATRSQYIENSKNACKAVKFDRYAMYFMANVCAFCYGLGKFELFDWNQSLPLLIVATIGIVTNVIMLKQIMKEGDCPAIFKVFPAMQPST